MNVRYESAFERDLKNIRDSSLMKRIKKVIETVKEADTIEELSNRSRYLVISDIIFFRQNKQAVKA